MTEIAALGLKADSSGVVAATEDLKSLAGAADQAEKAADKLSGGAKKADDAVKREGDSARKAAGDNKRLGDEVRTTEGAMHRMAEAAGGVVGRLIAMAGAAVSVGAYIKMADAWSDMRSQLGAAIGDMDSANGMMQRMTDIANASYAPLGQTVQTYARNVSVLRDLGKSADEAADFTESLNHMLVITATKGQQAESVQNALSKAMATGRLQAEGLESVLANGGRVAEALAEELGTTVSGLRDFASQGKITGEVIANAIINPLEEVRDVAGEMPATIGDAFGRVGTNLTALIGTFDQATGVSGALAERIVSLADGIGSLTKIDFAAWADTAGAAASYLAAVLGGLAVTQIPAVVAGLYAKAGAFSVATLAANAYAVAARAAGAAMAFMGGPLGLVVGAMTALGLAYLVAARRSRESAAQMKRDADELRHGYISLRDAWQDWIDRRDDHSARSAADLLTQQIERQEAQLASLRKQYEDTLADLRIEGEVSVVYGPLLDILQKIKIEEQGISGLRAQLAKVEADIAEKVEAQRAIYGDMNAEQRKSYDRALEIEASYQRQAELRKVEQQYGRESLQYKQAQLEQERQIELAKLEQMRATAENNQQLAEAVQKAIEAVNAHYDAESATHRWAGAMRAVRGELNGIAAVISSLGGGAIDRAAMQAELDVLRRGGSVAEARKSGIRSRQDQELEQQIGGLGGAYAGVAGVVLRDSLARTRALEDELEAEYKLASERERLAAKAEADSARRAKGAAAKTAEEMANRWKSLQEGFASEYMLAMQHYARDQETLQWALDTKRISHEEYQDSLAMLHTSAWGSEQERAALQYQMDQEALQAALDTKLIAYETYYAKLRELQWGQVEELGKIRDTGLSYELGQMASAFGDMQSLAGSNYDSLLRAQRVFGAASALISTYQGAAKALELPFPMNMAAMGKVMAAGMGLVNAIKSSGKGGTPSGRAGASGAASAPAAPQEPIRATLDGLNPNQLYTGQALIDLFEAVQKEAGNRGIVWTPV